MAASRPAAAVPRRPVMATQPASRSLRTATRAPVLSVDYGYLRRDLRTLSILAPLMVALLIVSYFVFH